MEDLYRVDECVLQHYIEGFSLDEGLYQQARHPKVEVKNSIGNRVLMRNGARLHASIKINFSVCVGCSVFLEDGVSGKIEIFFRASHSVVYIGKGAALQELQVVIAAPESRMLIGGGVTTSGFNRWIANSSSDYRDVIVGDDCMFSSEITVRNSDGHPVYDANTWDQVNLAKNGVVIEPHCWIGRGSSILKNVQVGACSIVAMGAVVSRSSPPFSVLAGVPAVANVVEGRLWTRGPSYEAKLRAYELGTKFGMIATPPKP